MIISQKGIDLIKGFEGFSEHPYKPVPTEKYLTIGYGHYGPDVTKDCVISQGLGEVIMKADLAEFMDEINKIKRPLTQGQFDALVSWTYNLGAEKLHGSTMYKKLVAGAPAEEVTDEMVKWVKSNGVALTGLKNRRIAEANMFLGRDRYCLEDKIIMKH